MPTRTVEILIVGMFKLDQVQTLSSGQLWRPATMGPSRWPKACRPSGTSTLYTERGAYIHSFWRSTHVVFEISHLIEINKQDGLQHLEVRLFHGRFVRRTATALIDKARTSHRSPSPKTSKDFFPWRGLSFGEPAQSKRFLAPILSHAPQHSLLYR